MNDTTSTCEHAPKYLAIKTRLADEIRAGRLRDGEFLPGEEELSRLHRVSRSTVRSALRALRTDGLIESTQGRRSVVCAASDPSRMRRFIWVGHRSAEREEPARVPQYNALVRLVEQNRATLTYWMMQGDNDDRWLIEHLKDYDGLVLADIGSTELLPELARTIRAFGNSVGTQDRSDRLTRCICQTDDEKIGELAAEFLSRRNFARVALIGVSRGLRSLSLSRDYGKRINGFLSAYARLGHGRHQFPTVLSDTEADFADPRALLTDLKLRENRIQALWVLSDAYAIRCIEALRKMKFKIPEEISVLGCDGIGDGASAPVPLTTIAHPFRGIAEAVLRQLLDHVGREAAPRVISVAPEVIVRESVKEMES